MGSLLPPSPAKGTNPFPRHGSDQSDLSQQREISAHVAHENEFSCGCYPIVYAIAMRDVCEPHEESVLI
jgi:hypothetical protein